MRRYGECDVTIVFKENARDIKDDVLWLMLENYKERIMNNTLINICEEDKKTGLLQSSPVENGV